MLAGKGGKVLVLERNDRIGGCIRTEEITAPGFIHDVMATTFVLFITSPAYAALAADLGRHGLEFCHTDTPTGVLQPDGSHAVLRMDRAANVAAFNATAAGDGDRHGRDVGDIERNAGLLFGLLGGGLWSYPTFKLHALSPSEVLHISRLAKLSTPEVIARLVDAGLDSIPGGGAEILVDRVRKLLNCYSKSTADEWLRIMGEAHEAGLRTTATMMYGSVETDEERIEHLVRLRELQDRTGGFTAFIAWSYQPEHTELGLHEATGVDYLRTLALARIVLDNFDNLQASWVTQGGKVGQLSLAFGANDMGSVMIEENVVRAAGASYCMDEVEIVRNIENAGFAARRRNMHYEVLGEPIFRERAVPRRLALDVAKSEDDDDRIPDELAAYDARTPAARRLRAQQRDGTITH